MVFIFNIYGGLIEKKQLWVEGILDW